MVWLSFLLLLHLITKGFALHECDKCKCCKGGSTRCQRVASDAICQDGCIDGFYSYNCLHACKNNCLSCTSVQSCTKCSDGYYGTYCDECPNNCLTCSDLNHCKSCNDGFYKGRLHGNFFHPYFSDCRHHCQKNCISCKSYHTCTGCIDGYYNDGYLDCRKNCKIECKSCTSNDTCTECVDGKYNGIYGDCRETCNSACIACTSFNNCTACPGGKYGSLCQNNCGLGCQNHQCDINNGRCTCMSKFYGDKCDQCVDGKYGIQCNMTCSTNCLPDDEGRKCFYTNGNCVKDCHIGHYGNMCQYHCSENCINITCSRTSGACKFGCVSGFEGNNCTKSKSGVMVDSENTTDSPNIGLIIGACIGSIAAILLVVGIVIILRRCLKHRQIRSHTPERSHELTDVQRENVRAVQEPPNIERATDSGYVNTAFPVYEQLKANNKNSNIYDRIEDTNVS